MARNDSFRVRWASNPAQFEKPQTSLIERGWAGGANEDPPEAKWENWWHNRVDEALAELEAHGALRWFSDVPYQAGAVVWHAGQRWLALDESVGVEPGGPLADGVWAPDVPIGKPTADPAEAITGSLLSGAMLAAGAIVEQGENANGNYMRWESGLQACWNYDFIIHPGTPPREPGVYSATWTFPASFISTSYYVGQTPTSTRPDLRGTTSVGGRSASSATIYRYDDSSASVVLDSTVVAIGMWK